MLWEKEIGYKFWCDECGRVDLEAVGDLKGAMEAFRLAGWKIGKRVRCPACAETSKRKD